MVNEKPSASSSSFICLDVTNVARLKDCSASLKILFKLLRDEICHDFLPGIY